MPDLSGFLIIFPVLLLSIAIHEFAHCWTADRLGDDTPRRAGRLTLNPLAHLDPLGTVMIVIASLAGFGIGWGKASPFNSQNFRNPARDRMIVAVAGPLSNILQMLAWASLGLLISATPLASSLSMLCLMGVIVNAVLAIFNLLPVYPLDGHHLLSYLAPPALRPIIDNQIWGIVFLMLVFIPQLRSSILGPIMDGVRIGGIYICSYVTGWPPLW